MSNQGSQHPPSIENPTHIQDIDHDINKENEEQVRNDQLNIPLTQVKKDNEYKEQSDGDTPSFQKSALAESLEPTSISIALGSDIHKKFTHSVYPFRKTSLCESELNSEEQNEDELDIRRKINQKLIRNKNYFMDFIGKNIRPLKPKLEKAQQAQQKILTDKRSRSETPDKMSATEVLFKVHQKLSDQSRRKDSPNKLAEKQQQRQKKAEEMRTQIEQSRKSWFDKIRIRQQVAKERWRELIDEKKARLQDKMEQAEERRETEIQSLVNKAKQEIQKIDETNYIVKMTQSNLKLDLDMKMNETQERRNQIMEEHIKKKQQDRALKEEMAEKRRQALQKSTENKFLTNQQKREQAEQRRSKMIEEKKKAAQEAQKRSMVLQRKNDLEDRMSDVMSFVNNSECIWDFLGSERDWKDLGAFCNSRDVDVIYNLLQKDYFEIEKLKLKRDAELLNQMIIITEDGQVFANKSCIPQDMQGHQFTDDEDSQLMDEDNEKLMDNIDNIRDIYTPEKVTNRLGSPDNSQTEESKSMNDVNEHNQDYHSDGSDKVSIPEEAMKDERHPHDEDQSQDGFEEIMSDEILNYNLYSQRLKMSMKRNILKKNLSEDLTWADFLKNESYINQQAFPLQKQIHTRSMRSTPEKKEIASDQENTTQCEEAQANNNIEQILPAPQEHKKSKKKKNKNQNQNNTSSSSNLSEKSRISSVVYPSQKKKIPKNQVTQGSQQPEIKGNQSFNSFKKNTGSSNQSSTQSLAINQQSFSETPNMVGRKSTHIDTDSARKRTFARLHSSSVQESSASALQQSSIKNHNASLIEEQAHNSDKMSESFNQSYIHTGSQMNSLITNTRPSMAQSKIIPKKLSVHASKILFPIREQKLLLKRTGKEGQFGKFKISVKIEDILSQKNLAQSNTATPASSGFLNDIIVEEKHKLQNTYLPQNIDQPKETSSGKKSNQGTPSQIQRRESIEGNCQFQSQNKNSQSDPQLGTPPQQQQARTDQFQQKLQDKHIGQQNNSLDQPAIKNNIISSQSQLNSIPSESSLSPPTKKDSKLNVNNTRNTEDNSQTPNLINLNQAVTLTNECLNQMNEQGYKELLVKYLLQDYIQFLKTDDNQKTIAMEFQEADKLIDYLEAYELNLKYCRLCDLIIPEHLTHDAHCQMKSHKKTREELGIKENEDLQYSIVSISSIPGDIEKELIKEKEKALKRKVKRIKTQMISQSVSHESAAYNPGKEHNSTNKKRLQILCIDMEKQVIPIINNYETLENTLKEIIKILDMRKQADLHLMRKLKYIPILIEICKRISVCHKNEFKYLGRTLDYVIKIISIFCGLRENRNYMLQTNRMLALIELLNWCLNRPTQLFYGINFMPSLFHILTLHVKHRAPYECQQMKEMFIEYLICSQITNKIKSKFQIINGPLDLSEQMGQVPLFLLKSAVFIESLTNILQIDAIVRPVYEKSTKIGEHILFVIQNTELFGIIPMITTILLSRNQPFKPSSNYQQVNIPNKILPQTLLSLAIFSVKTVNNILRMDYKAAQQMMSDFEIKEQLYHLFNYILYYTVETAENQEDSKELLHETLLLIGYFALFNEKHQEILCRGENTLLQKLCNLPFPYFCDKKLKEILFPTLIQASYKNDRSLAIMDQEISIEMLVDFIQLNLKEELPKIVEEMDDYHSISSLGGHQVVERRTRSPSQSSTSSQASMQIDMANGNSPYLPLYMRFPKKLWQDAISFYSKVLY